MAYLFLIAFFVALYGVFRPFQSMPQAKRWHYGLAAFVSFMLVGMTAEPPEGTGTAKSDTTPNAKTASPSPVSKDEPPSAPASNWTYDTSKDEMRGGVERYASLDAENTVKLDFPYGEQRGRVLIRQSPRFGFDIMVGVPSGQIMCNSYSNSYLSVKFDDGPVQRFGCTDASDGTNNMVFIESEKAFLAKLKKSKRMMVEAEFFQNGLQQFTFNTENLEWE